MVKGGGGSSSGLEGSCDAALKEAILMLAARVFLPGLGLAVGWLDTIAAHVEGASAAEEDVLLSPALVSLCMVEVV